MFNEYLSFSSKSKYNENANVVIYTVSSKAKDLRSFNPDESEILYPRNSRFIVENIKKVNGKSTGIFAAGVAFGTAGIKALSSNDAKKLYTNLTAAALRAKECVMQTVTKVQENAGDIYEEAKQINEERAAKEAVYDDEDLKEVEEVEAEAETEETEAEETTEETAEQRFEED